MDRSSVLATSLVFAGAAAAPAINIRVDYRYDTNNFFDTQPKQDAIEAAAKRFSDIITTSLSAATFEDNGTDPRIGFTNPGTGASWDVSPAASSATDALAGSGIAEEYRGPWTLPEDEWVLYVAGRPQSSTGLGGTGTGLNFTSVFADGNSHLNRGFRPTGSVSNLPVWGGQISFDSDGDVTWHFDLETPAPIGTVDFYSIAVHEIGHALGLNSSWIEWSSQSPGGVYSGANAVAAYNADNGTSLTSLNLVSASNPHWQDGVYEAEIFAAGNPNLAGTVGLGALQDLLMEPTANFTSTQRRIEVTTVDVAALRDVGWEVISNTVTPLPGDANGDGTVDLLDLDILGANFGSTNAGFADGDFNGDGNVDLLDLDILGANFGAMGAAAVPEPCAIALCGGFLAMSRRRRR